MSADSPSAADRIARFAELVEAVDVEGVTIVDHNTSRLVESGELQGTIDLRVGDVPTSVNGADVQDEEDRGVGDGYIGTESGLRDELEEFEAEQDAEADDTGDVDAEAVSESVEKNGADVDEDTDDEDESEDIWCGVCGAGPFEMLSIHAGRVHDGDEIALDHEPAVTELVDPPAEMLPDYEGPDPEQLVADSSLPARVVLEDVLDAAVDATRADAPVVSIVTDELGVRSDAAVPVLRELGLQEDDSRQLVDDVGVRVAAIRQEVSDE